MSNKEIPPAAPDRSILVVDDDREYLQYMEMELTEAGYRPHLAASARDALELLGRSRYALVITDLYMPAMSGFELLAEVRAIDPLTVGVVMTAFGSVDSAIDAVRRGAYDYIFKPSSGDVILASVRRALEHHAMQGTLIRQAAQLQSLRNEYKKTVRVLQDVSGKLRNPLAAIRGTATSLSDFSQRPAAAGLSPEVNMSIGLIAENTELLCTLLNEIEVEKLD